MNDKSAPVSSTAAYVAMAAGVAWLACAVLIGYLAYQQRTLYQLIINAGLEADQYGTAAVWNAFAALISLLLGTRILLRPGRRLLTWSVAWAAMTMIGGVVQVKSGVGDAPSFVLVVLAAGVAGVLSYVGRSALALGLKGAPPATSGSGAMIRAEPPAPSPAPPAPAPPAPWPNSASTAPVLPPPAPPAPAPSPPPPAAAPPAPAANPALLALAPRPELPEAPAARPAAAGAPPSATADLPRERTSPVLIVGVILSALLAVGVIGYVVASGVGSSFIGSLSPTPTPIPTAAPTPQPTPSFAGAGDIVFGIAYDPATLLIDAPRTRFKTNFRHPIAWSASLTGPVGTRDVGIIFSRRSTDLIDTTLYAGTITTSSAQAELIAGQADLAALAGHQPGTYVLQLTRSGLVLAEGTFTLVR